MLGVYRVEGASMLPTLADGDYVVASRWYARIRPGDILVIDHPRYRRIVKRVLRVCKRRGLLLGGDNATASVDPHMIGWISPQRVLGKRLWSVRQPRPA